MQNPIHPSVDGAALPRALDLSKRLKFDGGNDFHRELRRRVDAFLRTSGRRQRDCAAMYWKTAIILGGFSLAYVLLVFVVQTWWQALPIALLLATAVASIGFNIQHDGGHQAFSKRPWINKATALTLDMVGGSSYIWRWKHAVFHHSYVNVYHHDSDIDLGILARLTPHQQRLRFQRWQHWYIWPLYGVMAMRWHFYGDFRDLLAGRIGEHAFPRPKGWDLLLMIGGKALFFTLAFVIPLLLHPFWAVALFYALTMIVVGMMLSVVFQLAHCVEQADFPLPSAETGRMDKAWAVHQVETTVNFARRSKTLAWLLGGLNFQIEHHLFPSLCHIHYPAISKLVEDTCREFGVRYSEHRSLWSGVASHFRWIRRMGMPVAAV